jgi:ABC-2 type transport system ATP-binding protein
MLTCQLRPTGGTAHVKGIPLTDERGIRSIIGIVPQELALNDLLTAYQNLVLYGSLYGVSRVDAKRRALEMLEAMGLEKRKNDLVKDFSGGMKQRLNVVMALMHEPKVLFLDEPTTGMDPQARRMIWDFIRDINKRGTTIFLTTHYMEEADYLCNRVSHHRRGSYQGD